MFGRRELEALTALLSLAAPCALPLGCAAPARLPPVARTERAAAFVQSRCTGVPDDASVRALLSGQAVESVEPFYTEEVSGGAGTGSASLRGATIYVRPAPGETAEWLNLALECHNARRRSSSTGALYAAIDPFFVQGSHVAIHVQSGGDKFRIDVESPSREAAGEILERATALASATQRGLAAEPELQ